jgi:hypothetical protein
MDKFNKESKTIKLRINLIFTSHKYYYNVLDILSAPGMGLEPMCADHTSVQKTDGMGQTKRPMLFNTYATSSRLLI